MKKVLPVLLLLFFVVRPASASDDDDNFRPEVLRCEEAVGKLVECCPSFDPKSADCSFSTETRDSGCDFHTTVAVTPALNPTETGCILDRDCNELRAAKVCERATGLGAYVSVYGDNDGPTPWRAPNTHPSVCP